MLQKILVFSQFSDQQINEIFKSKKQTKTVQTFKTVKYINKKYNKSILNPPKLCSTKNKTNPFTPVNISNEILE